MPCYCCSSWDFLQSYDTVLLSSFHLPFQWPLDVVVHLLVFLRSFTFKSFFCSLLLSNRSRISAVTQVFFSWRCLQKDLTRCFSHCCVEGSDCWTHVCIFITHDGERCKPIIAWKVSNTLGSFSISRSNLSQVCFGLLILFRRRWKIIISKSGSLPMSASGKLLVLARSSSASHGHFLCLLLENLMFWQCSQLTSTALNLIRSHHYPPSSPPPRPCHSIFLPLLPFLLSCPILPPSPLSKEDRRHLFLKVQRIRDWWSATLGKKTDSAKHRARGTTFSKTEQPLHQNTHLTNFHSMSLWYRNLHYKMT